MTESLAKLLLSLMIEVLVEFNPAVAQDKVRNAIIAVQSSRQVEAVTQKPYPFTSRCRILYLIKLGPRSRD